MDTYSSVRDFSVIFLWAVSNPSLSVESWPNTDPPWVSPCICKLSIRRQQKLRCTVCSARNVRRCGNYFLWATGGFRPLTYSLRTKDWPSTERIFLLLATIFAPRRRIKLIFLTIRRGNAGVRPSSGPYTEKYNRILCLLHAFDCWLFEYTVATAPRRHSLKLLLFITNFLYRMPVSISHWRLIAKKRIITTMFYASPSAIATSSRHPSLCALLYLEKSLKLMYFMLLAHIPLLWSCKIFPFEVVHVYLEDYFVSFV